MPDGLLRQLQTGGPRLTVGMITADLLSLGSEIRLLEEGGAQLVHVDVMDGVFCPMLTVGPPVVKALRTSLIKDVHLMVDDPLAKIDAFVAAGADMITFHVEGAPQPHRVLQALGAATNANDPERGIIRGVGINPSTPVEVLEPLLDEVDYILVLAINPGWGGQPFVSTTARRIARVRAMVGASGRDILVGVDGAVTRGNIHDVAGLGADIIVSGSAIFDGKAVADNLRYMLDAVAAARKRSRPLVAT
jgi:ribulose-phosphate 3-epimerase